MKAGEILETARNLVTGDRHKQNGNALRNHENIALAWTADSREKYTPIDVVRRLILLKLNRTKSGEFNIDDWIDICGYAALGGEFASTEVETDKRQHTAHDPDMWDSGRWVGQHGYHE